MPKKTKQSVADWRKLKEGSPETRKKPLSWRARFKSLSSWIKRILVAAAIVAAGSGAYYVYSNFYVDEILSGKTGNIKNIELKTDGAITGKWLGAFLKIPPRAKLDDINIFAVKKSLEDLEQVTSASVERIYPDVLRITITELKPMMRVTVKINGGPRTYLMSPNGVFFRPVSMDRSFIEKLPRIEDARISFDGSRPRPYANAHKVREFLAYAQKLMPEELAKWRAINVRELDSVILPLIIVKTEGGAQIVFATQDYQKQFDRLDYILRYSQQRPLKSIERIDLSLKDRADVRISDQRQQ